MTALTEDKAIQRTEGVLLDFPVHGSTKIYGGSLVAVDADGYLHPGADTAGLIFQGVADEQVDNSSGSDGALNCTVRRRGLFLMTLGTAISQANVGDNVFLEDDQTVDVVGNVTNAIFCGIIAKFVSTTSAWIDIEPAIRQADVATHIADTSAAHAASAISILDSGTFTAAEQVEAALAEIYQDLISAQACVLVPLTALREVGTMAVGDIAANGGVLASDTTPILKPINGATDGCQIIQWAASNNDPVVFAIPLPPDLDTTKDLVLHTRIVSAGTTDAVGFTVDSWFNEGDTKVTDTSATNQTATWAEKTATIAAADVPTGAQTVTISLTPVAHTTDAMSMSAVWLEYTRKLRTS